jgi:catechol 2,3-dioxygenase-like lactoylglutathione lyase family enzyme
MKINGIGLIQLTVADFEACEVFYTALMALFEMTTVFADYNLKYWTGGRTALAIKRSTASIQRKRFVHGVGLDHLCFRARSKRDVMRAYELLQRLGAKIIHAPGEGPWTDYFAVVFEDPDGIPLEVAHLPGKDETITLPIRRLQAR